MKRTTVRAIHAGVAIATASLLVGCGSGGPSHADCEKLHAGPTYLACMNGESTSTHATKSVASANATPTEAPAEEVGGPLDYVGSITESGHGTTFVDSYSVGPLLYGSDEAPPEDLLNACNYARPQQIDSSVFMRGQLKVTYHEGSIPTSVPTATELIGGEGTVGTGLALNVNGGWQCTELIGTSFEFQPGETQTFPFWLILPGILTNEKPQVPKEVQNSWYFNFFGDQLGLKEVTVSGPGKGQCEENYSQETVLLLYGRSGKC